MRLGIGDELKCVALNPEFPYKLAPMEEVLELHPELPVPVPKATVRSPG